MCIRDSFLTVPHHAHLCSEHFSECCFANPMEYRMGFCFEADTMFWYCFKILPDRLKLLRLYPCGSLGQSVSFVFRARVGHFAATPESDVVGYGHVIWASWRRFRYDRKCLFFVCIYYSQITVSPTSSFSASFNRNRVKNHP